MRAMYFLVLLVLVAGLVGCATQRPVSLIDELFTAGCDIQAYETSGRMQTTRVLCK